MRTEYAQKQQEAARWNWLQLGPKLAPSWAKLASAWHHVEPELASNWPQVGLRRAKVARARGHRPQLGPKLAQDGAKLAPSWAKLASASHQVDAELAPNWPQVGPRRAKAARMGCRRLKKHLNIAPRGQILDTFVKIQPFTEPLPGGESGSESTQIQAEVGQK